MRKIEYIITQIDSGKSIRDFLKHRGYSTAVITLLKKCDNGITVNGARVFTNYVLNTDDILTVHVSDKASDIAPEKLDFKVVYEDEDILVYDKPYGVVVHPTKVYQSGTLGNDYAYRCMELNRQCTFRPVYRIDRNTSGLVLIAKNKIASCVDVLKRYICICHGKIAEQGSFYGDISLCKGSKIKREVTQGGQSAVTHYKRIAVSDNYSLCEVVLETGRTHQIRVHFSNSGYPLVGDGLYGFDNDGLSRHALHCSEIKFTNPITCQKVELRSDLPNDMKVFIENNKIL